MHFKVTARTILQLGAELISSDAIAFYELIKNAFDADSKKVEVRIVSRLPQKFIHDTILELEKPRKTPLSNQELQVYRQSIIGQLNREAFKIDQFRNRITIASEAIELVNALKKANYILIRDWGEGMSLLDLENIYLTIGTRNRKEQKKNLKPGDQPILGEKGLGRLSVMRLGDSLYVETTQKGEKNYNELNIDWTWFSNDDDDFLESVDINPIKGKLKSDSNEQGTKIFIYHLRSEWSEQDLEDISESQLTRFVDPFQRKNRDFIKLWFNNEPVLLPNIDQDLFKYSHAIVKAELKIEDGKEPAFVGQINYKLYNREKTFSLSGVHLLSALKSVSIADIKDLGPFEIIFYWYNRLLLTTKNGVPDAKRIKDLVENWGGGLMVFRDGFRVNPYGGPNDDWLGLDPQALKSPGYKLNRKQFVGKVDITTLHNPHLLDQTNREGLRDNNAKEVLVTLLQYLIWNEVKTFFDDVKKEFDQNSAVDSLVEIERRILVGHNQVRGAVDQLKHKYPAIQTETKLLATIEDVLDESSKLFKVAKASAEELKERLKTTLDLAGLGLMVDVIAHELNRSTEHALRTIDSFSSKDSAGMGSTLDTLRSQLKTLQARLKVIDPLGPSGRQKKVDTDIKKIINETVLSHENQFSRHNITFHLHDKNKSSDWNLKVVPGMIVQVIENLISNSVYWIKQQQNIEPDFKGEISIRIDRNNSEILFSDNGPGVPFSRKEDVFRPFFTTKPPGDGKGLGLYISKEIAKYHDADFFLLNENNVDHLNTFVLSLKKPNTL